MTLIVRSVFTCLFAVAQALQNTGDNVHSNIQGWIVYIPAFQMVTTLIASPIALLVALWGMSGVGGAGANVVKQCSDAVVIEFACGASPN